MKVRPRVTTGRGTKSLPTARAESDREEKHSKRRIAASLREPRQLLQLILFAVVVAAVDQTVRSLHRNNQQRAFEKANFEKDHTKDTEQRTDMQVHRRTVHANDTASSYTSFQGLTRKEIKNVLNCSVIMQGQRPIHSQETWKEMRRLYTSVVGWEESTVGHPEAAHNGFGQPYRVQHNNYGRGIYAAADIPKGAILWQNIRTAQFSRGDQYREFLRRLENGLACDVLIWAYVDRDRKINVDLDERSFCNNGKSEKSNMDLDTERTKLFPSRATMQLFATRDISKGEELLCNYRSFSSGNWKYFGL